MEVIKEGKLTIQKGDNFVTIHKEGYVKDQHLDLWSFVDGLVKKGYEVSPAQMIFGGHIFITMIKK
jgi:hypothetical protein